MSDQERPAPPSSGELPWVLEAMLFVTEEPLPISVMARAIGVGEGSVRRALVQLRADYEARGLRLQEDGHAYQLVTAPEYAGYISQLLGSGPGQRLSRAALETLTIIAYRQPCSRSEVEAVRGVNSDRLIATLEGRGLVEVAGTGDTVGKPKLYRTTASFYEYFGIEGPHALPPLPDEVLVSPLLEEKPF